MNESAFNWSVNCEEEMQINKAVRLHRFLWSYLVCFWNGAPPQHWITIWMTKCHSLCRWGVSSNESLLYLGKTPASVHTVEWSTRSGQLLQLRYLFTLGNKWSSDRREVYENNEIGHKIAEKTSTPRGLHPKSPWKPTTPVGYPTSLMGSWSGLLYQERWHTMGSV